MATMQLNSIYKIYDNGFEAVKDFNIDIKHGEFIVFVGPSGCGKSTTLRMIAGLEDISKGEFYIDERLVNDVQPKDRDIAMVFQSYALYPHMSVYDNMAFGLKLRKIDKAEIDEKVTTAAKMLGLDHLLDRKPKALSGGQRQRVALGRAVVRHPKVFLMDEPLSNLDAKLRGHMRAEIIKLHKNVGATTIYVTHDQTEAMTMADRIVVMKDGIVQQIDTPKDIYDTPENLFVAGFIGSPTMNFITGTIKNTKFMVSGQEFAIPGGKYAALKNGGYEGKEVVLGIRPEGIGAEPLFLEAYADATFHTTINVAELLGPDYIIHTSLGDASVTAVVPARETMEMGKEITLALDMNKAHFFDKVTEQRIR
ncbi:MAG: ABC transporter ATP-binding protein [Culicoidibacterales bacterium]